VDGAVAKRADCCGGGATRLVTTPHAVRRVVVARSARIAASLAIVMVGAALLALASDSSLVDGIGQITGQPAVLSTLLAVTWIAGICAWWVARARVEHRFAVAMSR